MKLTIGHTGVVVSDLARMRDFYSRVLGLTETMHATHEGAHIDGLTGLDGVRLEVIILGTEDRPQGVELLKYHAHPSAPTDPAPNRNGMNHVHFVTDDLSAVVAALQAEGLDFCGAPQAWPVRWAQVLYAKDPEGNVLEFTEPRAE